MFLYHQIFTDTRWMGAWHQYILCTYYGGSVKWVLHYNFIATKIYFYSLWEIIVKYYILLHNKHFGLSNFTHFIVTFSQFTGNISWIIHFVKQLCQCIQQFFSKIIYYKCKKWLLTISQKYACQHLLSRNDLKVLKNTLGSFSEQFRCLK